MFDRSWSVMFVLSAMALMPLAVQQSEKHVGFSEQKLALRLTAKPVTVGVHVATVMRPLDLGQLTHADFGDTEVLN